jgi:Fe-S-cluster containining protein
MKKNKGKKSVITPQKLTPESPFTFRCHPEIACFTKCCSDIKIILTPYDILRMKQRLDITSIEFLSLYTRTERLNKSDLPVVVLNMLDDSEKKCPFVTPQGCTIYTDRPATCRYYPIGFALGRDKNVQDTEEHFFFVKEDHCLGFQEETEWTVQSWREDQEPELYDSMNRDWAEILIKRLSSGPEKVPDRSVQLFFMVSYDLDSFRKFVFESPFLQNYNIDSETVEKISNDESELMLFGLKWLKSTLFGV